MSGWLENTEGFLGPEERVKKPATPRRISSGPEEEPQKTVLFIPVRCPVCKSKHQRVYCIKPQTPGQPVIRHHVCAACGMRFKSVEEL